jgi:hypothetical protein
VRQSGCAAHFERAWHELAFLDLQAVPRSRLSLRALPESFLFFSDLPPHRTHKAARNPEARVSCRSALRKRSNSTGTFGKPAIDFHSFKRMITKGEGVRLITAVLSVGQMMTPDKFLVAESCPGDEPANQVGIH